MQSAEIARRFLAHFEARGHAIVPSASLVADDPTLLFVVAGMQPFKPYLLGQQTPPWKRVADVQKVVRTLDIEEVGKTTRHATFFQMLGNWSFGDYFKEDAIRWAWELLTKPEQDGGFGFPKEKLWATVLHGDDESYAIWRDQIGVPESRIQRRGLKDNYWHMGVPGPGGPCSEIYYDRGPEYGVEGGPEADEDRYLEVWNLVFMQDMLSEVRAKDDFDVEGPLPFKNVDTGMGLERMASILQGVDNIYEIDTTYKILEKAAELTEQEYGRDQRNDIALRVVADHVRSAVMLIQDGVQPSNEGGGYVLRRLLRRSIRNLRLLSGAQRGGGASASTGFMHELTAVTIAVMADQFPELRRDATRIHTIIDAEEAAFAGTLRTGTAIFDVAVEETRRKHASVLSGAQAFQLHDTYGFPIDLTLEMASEQGLTVDEEGFRRLMAEQRDRAKKDAREKKTGNADISAYASLLEQAGRVTFTGYDAADGEATIVGLLVDGVPVQSAAPGSEVAVVLDRTPFYAEGGGQLSDHGVIKTNGAGGNAEVEVTDVQTPLLGLIVHRGVVRHGEITTGSPVWAEIDVERRRATSRSHTATHLVHRALRGALGESAAQAGSENAPGRLRFDFTATGAVPLTVLREVEDEVNRILIDDLSVRAFHTSIDEARAMGALALFSERYGSEVRVVEVGEYSRELCGGTHVARSGQLGLVKLLGEASIGSGVRRIEALVGIDAFRFLARESVLVNQLSDQLKARPEELPERISIVVGRLRDAERELAKLKSAQLLEASGQIAAAAENIGGIAFVAHRVPDGTDADSIRRLALDIRAKVPALQPAVVALTGTPADRPVVVIAVNEAARGSGLSAGTLVGGAARALGGGGGGKPDIAQGGGAPGAGPAEVNAAFDSIRSALRDKVETGG
ncbi:alanine--tRNA ligase [Trebonia kvetii]|uniref:Alanine--tRNA ligase n=1 Tax=Trebonia kvetii TaxID=2480626 RepID=A0A6P2BUT3_9ACTN|nr:alanine--tRNA ligase [Trebonia kvetii]TVZ00973.1 alanine--tRNA ligase [Trebonia kvetii]